jgi:hypothetical protein
MTGWASSRKSWLRLPSALLSAVLALWPAAVLIFLLMVWVMAGEASLERLGFRTKAMWSKMWE